MKICIHCKKSDEDVKDFKMKVTMRGVVTEDIVKNTHKQCLENITQQGKEVLKKHSYYANVEFEEVKNTTR